MISPEHVPALSGTAQGQSFEKAARPRSALRIRKKKISYCLIGEDEMLVRNLDVARRLPVFFHSALSQHLEAL